MTILEHAGARLANAVAVFLNSGDPSARTGLKLAFSEYREAESRHAAFRAGAAVGPEPSEAQALLKRLQNVRLALGGATYRHAENGAHMRELPDDEWDALCDALKAIEVELRAVDFPREHRVLSEDEIEQCSGFKCPACGRQSLYRNITAMCSNQDCEYIEGAVRALPHEEPKP